LKATTQMQVLIPGNFKFQTAISVEINFSAFYLFLHAEDTDVMG